MAKGKKGKKKMSAEERLEAAINEAKALKDTLEEQRKALIDELTSGIQQDILDAQEQLQFDIDIEALCVKQLEETERKFKAYAKRMSQKKNNDNQQERWNLYMKCDKVPDAALVTEVNNYIYRWEIDENAPYPEQCKWRIKSAIELLEKLQGFIDEPLRDSQQYLSNLIEVKECAREHLKQQIDRTTYYILKEMESTMESRGLNLLQISMGNEYFSLCVWGVIPYPKTCFPIPKAERPALVCNFEEITMNVTMPDTLWGIPHALRLVQLKYDNLSDYCQVYLAPPLPDHLTAGLKTVITQDWKKRLELEKIVAAEREARKQEIEAISRIKIKTIKGKEMNLKAFKEQLQILKDNIETLKTFQDTPIKSATQRLIEEEDALEDSLKTELIPDLREGELNLRQYMILGGVYCVQAVVQPPQPMELLSDYMMTTLELPKAVKLIPLPEEPLEEEPVADIEDEAILYTDSKPAFKSGSILASVLGSQTAQKSVSKLASLSASKSVVKSRSKVDAETKPDDESAPKLEDKPEIVVFLPVVNLSLPQDILWYKSPVVVIWDEDRKMWSMEQVQDLTFKEEDQMLVFNMNMFGNFALAVDRHTNLPYQKWEMLPGANGAVTFILTTPVTTLKFAIKDDVITLTEASNIKPGSLQGIIGQEYSLYQLKKRLLQKGVNIFPEHDTHCYIEGYMPKHRATEDHLYHCMAQLSACYRFMWSPQNHDAGRRLIILQIQQHSAKVTDTFTLCASPGKTSITKNVEAPEDGEQMPQASKTSSDLHHLIKLEAGFTIREKIANTSPVLIENVYAFLRKIRVLSFS